MTFPNSYLLTKILTPALQVWLHSQLDIVKGLHLQINSSDRQLWHGTIPKLLLNSEFAMYQGLRFDQVSVTAEQIKINIMQLLKGQPLNLLKPVPLWGTIQISQPNLSASLDSSLLQSGLKDFLSLLLNAQTIPSIEWNQIRLDHQQFILEGKQLDSCQTPIIIQADVNLKTPKQLLITPRQMEGLTLQHLEQSAVTLDLGSSVHIKQLTVQEKAVFLQGGLTIFPEETLSNQGKTC